MRSMRASNWAAMSRACCPGGGGEDVVSEAGEILADRVAQIFLILDQQQVSVPRMNEPGRMVSGRGDSLLRGEAGKR